MKLKKSLKKVEASGNNEHWYVIVDVLKILCEKLHRTYPMLIWLAQSVRGNLVDDIMSE